VIARIPSRKKRKVREKGYVIARIPSRKKRPETTTSCGPKNPIHQGIPTKRGLRQQQVVAQKIPSIKGFPPKEA
jgi:hypothetical protein